MSSTNETIRLVTIGIGLPIFICGTLGNLLNLRLLWPNRLNPCGFLFLAVSSIDIFVLCYGLLTRILSIGFQLDWSGTNLIWCKARVAFIQASYLISLTYTCLASIDRFLVSCREEKYRRLSQLSNAVWAVVLTILVWVCTVIPLLIGNQIVLSSYTGVMTCTFTGSVAFSNYQIYFSSPVFYGLLPGVILTVTGILTYKNASKLQRGRQRQLVQRQLTSMVLLKIPITLLSTLPYVAFLQYSMLTATVPKPSNQKAAELVISNVVSMTWYIAFACSFFIYFASSKSFRREAFAFIRCKKSRSPHQNQTHPCTITRNEMVENATL